MYLYSQIFKSTALSLPLGKRYSVMQSNGNSSYGDVVLNSFNKGYRDKDSILEQKYKKRIFWDLHYEDFVLRKIHIKRNTVLNNKEPLKLGFSATVVLAF